MEALGTADPDSQGVFSGLTLSVMIARILMKAVDKES
jgi:hypothetical protein